MLETISWSFTIPTFRDTTGTFGCLAKCELLAEIAAGDFGVLHPGTIPIAPAIPIANSRRVFRITAHKYREVSYSILVTFEKQNLE